MLDPQHCDAAVAQARHHLDERGGFGVRQPATDLIEQEDRGLDGQRARQLEAFALEQAQAFRAPVGDRGQPGLVQDAQAELIGFGAAPPPACSGADQNVLEDAHPDEGTRHLVGSGDTQLASVGGTFGGDVSTTEKDPPGVRRERS